jgi:peptide/nickel transport system substrate-binding protein
MGPADVQEPGPGEVREARRSRSCPKSSSRLAAMMSGRFDITSPLPHPVHRPGQECPDARTWAGQAQLPADVFRLQDHAALVSDVRVRKALSIAHQRGPRSSTRSAGARPAGLHLHPAGNALDYDPSTTKGIIKEDVARAGEAARRSRLEARSRRLPLQGRQAPDAGALWLPAGGRSPKITEAVQGYMAQDRRRSAIADVGLHHHAGEAGQQDYDLWSIAFPYPVAGDALLLYFHSRNIPVPNRMNWKDAETDDGSIPRARR